MLCRPLRAGAPWRAAQVARQSSRSRSQTRDNGLTLVEILISIVLLGTAASAGLATLRTSIMASTTNRDHSNAHAWLQTATDVLYGASREDCGTTTSSQANAARAAYQQVVRQTSNPQNWPSTNISVTSVLFWDGESTYQATCYDDFGINLQLITLQVTNPDGEIVESVQIVKG